MNPPKSHFDPDFKPSAELLAAHPELQFHLSEPIQDADWHSKPSLYSPASNGLANVLENDPLAKPELNVADMVARAEASGIIEQKAIELGGLPVVPTSTVARSGNGYVRTYQGCAIYYSGQTGAHEVHGDIWAKYNDWQGAVGLLGLPVTDETGTPDTVGRYNHFVGGSIYWSPSTGPKVVLNSVRNHWATQGWEQGEFGYPVRDSVVESSADWIQSGDQWIHPPASIQTWCKFQNGAIFSSVSSGNIGASALIAALTPEQLAQFVRNMIDRSLHKANADLGIEGGGRVSHVSDWGYGFLASRPRLVTFAIQGFHKNPLIPDTTFYLELTLEFSLVISTTAFKVPAEHTLLVALKQLYVHTAGVGHEELKNGLQSGIWDKFKEPLAVQTIPAGARLMDILITKTGGLEFLLEPNINEPMEENLRRYLFQNQLDNLGEN